MKFLSKDAWLPWTQAGLIQTNAILALPTIVEVTPHFCEDGEMHGSWILHSERGRGEISLIFGAGGLCRRVQLLLHVLRKARAPASFC